MVSAIWRGFLKNSASRNRHNCRGRALFLGTGYDSPAYQIYGRHGFESVEPTSGCMAMYSDSREEFEKWYFEGDTARIQPIVGTTNPERIAAACQAVDVELTREEWYRLFTAGRGARVP